MYIFTLWILEKSSYVIVYLETLYIFNTDHHIMYDAYCYLSCIFDLVGL